MEISKEKLQEFMGGVIGQLTGAATVACGLLGTELGLYKAMAGKGQMSANDLAKTASTNPRLTREWLDQQASVGFVDYSADSDCYELSPEATLAFAKEDSPVYVGGGFSVMRALMMDTELLAKAFKGDGGVPWGDHHPDLFHGVREFFRPAYLNFLNQAWLPALDGMVAKLMTGATVADVGCGHGASTTAMARAFPNSKFIGFDYHEPSIAQATKLAKNGSVANATFQKASAADFDGKYDLICFFDCLHDMGDPVGIARHARSKLASGGTVMLVEPFAHNSRAENHKGGLGGLFYGASTFICAPCSLSQEVGLAMGAQAGESKTKEIFDEAGFSSFKRATETPFNLVYEARA